MRTKIIAIIVMHLIVMLPVVSAWQITSVVESDITDKTATISFNTQDAPTTAQIDYGPDGNYGSYLVDSTSQTDHTFTLQDLDAHATYYYKLTATDSEGTVADMQHDYTNAALYFQTTAPPDTAAPVVAGDVALQLPSDTTATLSWTTDEASTTNVYWGLATNNLNNTYANPAYTSSHSASIGVTLGERYYYRIASCDEYGNCLNYTDSAFTFVAGQDNTAPYLSVDVPDKWGTTTLIVNGSTEAYASVFMYIDGSLRSQKQSDADGNFKFDVSIASYSGSITVKFVILDQVGFTFESEEYPILVNFDPPTLTLADTPPKSNSSSIILSGTVDPLCDVEFKVSGGQDQTPPGMVTNLQLGDIGTNSVELEWNENSESDVLEYLIYRDGTPISTTQNNEFTDTGPAVGSGVSYSYQIAAVDETCNIGGKSSEVSATTLEGGMEQSYEPDAANTTCENSHYRSSRRYQGAFSDTVSLEQGINYIQVSATNEYGNTVKIVREIDVDTDAPQIEDTNLDELASGPSYNREVTVRGRVSEASTVYVYLNNDSSPSDSCVTDANNEFSCEVRLEMRTDLSIDTDDSRTSETDGSFDLGYTFENKIKLVAVDETGKKGDSVEGNVIYAQCSQGSWFSVKFHDQTPDVLTPRLIIEGAGQIGLSVDVEWNAGTFTNATIRRNPKLYKRALSLADEDDWDRGWVSESIVCKRERSDYYQCYISLKIPAIDPTPSGENWTMFDMEENISNHRLGDCPIPGVGCIKIPLVLETEFELMNTNGTQKQKNCLDVYAYIDKRIPPDNIPEDFLESMVDYLNTTINGIDAVLEPLKKIRIYTLGACMVLYGVDFLMSWQEEFTCTFNDYLAKADMLINGKKANWKVGVARTGQCKNVYSTDDESEAQSKCQDCQDAIESRMSISNKMKWTCDRMFCPSAPSFQYFHEESKKKLASTDVKKKKIEKAVKALNKGDAPEIDFKNFEKESFSYDCALVSDANVYLLKNDQKGVPTKKVEEDCKKLHVPSEDCCETSYLQRWDSSCWLMDEFHESACLDAQYSDDPSKVGENSEKCNVLWNAAAGFCDPAGGPVSEFIKVSQVYVDPEELDDVGLLDGSEIMSNLFIRVMPKMDGENVEGYFIQPGYISTGISLGTSNEVVDPEESSPVTEQREFTPYKGYRISDVDDTNNLAKYFYIPTDNSVEGDSYSSKLASQMDKFRTEIAKIGCSTKSGREDHYKCKEFQPIDKKEVIDSAYEQIQSAIGTTAKKYVVDPPSTFARSLQCICINAIYEYLIKYRNVMQVVQNCFQTILLTGDGTAGVCREVISVYVCDALYDLIKCFSSKYSYSGGRGSFGGGIGNFLGSMSSASSSVSDRINNRYGSNNLFNAALGEGKIAHSICMWAFTGTWDLDPGALLETTSGMPIESTGAIYPCERRFISYNQANSGHATWAYSVAGLLVAGADLTYSIDLVCSDSLFGCDVQEGFSGGACDCVTTGQKTQRLTGGTLNQRDTLNEDFFKTFESKVRYDTAVLSWSYLDNNGESITKTANCSIQQKGGNPPAFCSFDIGTGEYRCDFNMGSESYGRFTGEVTPLYDNGEYFRLDEMMSFDIPVTFKKPQESDCSATYCDYTKWVYMKIKDQNKNTIGSCEFGPVDIFEEGAHSIPADTCKLSRSIFTSSSVKGTDSFAQAGHDADNSYPSSGTISTPPPVSSTIVAYLIHIKDDKFYYGTRSTVKHIPEANMGSSSQAAAYLDTSLTACEVVSGSYNVKCGNVVFTLGEFPLSSYALAFTLEPYTSTCNPDTDVYFYYDLYMYNARDEGGSYGIDYNSISTYENERQKKENQKFKVRCTETTAEMDPDTPVSCPDPMYGGWSDSGLSGHSKCKCGSGDDDYCNLDDTNNYCVNGVCRENPVTVPECEWNMKDLSYDYGGDIGDNAQCTCKGLNPDVGGAVCYKREHKYCIQDGSNGGAVCSSTPACKIDKETTSDCYCVFKDYNSDNSMDGYDLTVKCTAGQTCVSDGGNFKCQ